MLNKNFPHDNKDLIAYAAGLFDGEGNINYAQYKCNKPNGKTYLKWNVAMEIAMTNLDCIKNFYDIVKVGSIHFKGIGKGSLGKVDQWRWRCSHQKALHLAKLFLPYGADKSNNPKDLWLFLNNLYENYVYLYLERENE